MIQKLRKSPLFLLIIQAVLILFLIPFYLKDSTQQASLYLIFGALISAGQFGLLYFVWWRIFNKKKIAPSVFAVVSKYALLGLALWMLYPLNQEQMKALAVGILSNPVAIILFALTRKPK